MIPGFVLAYKSKDDGLIHVFFYPGYDESDRNIFRIDLISKQNLDYKYVKNQDRSLEYTITNIDSDTISFNLIENQSKEIKEYSFKVKDLIEL